MKITSNKETFTATPEKVFNVLIGFAKTEQVPSIPQVSDWKNLENGCQFTIASMLTCSMLLTDQVPFTRVVYQISTDKGISANATFHIQDLGNQCEVQIEAEANAPLFMQAMIKTPIEQAMNKGLAKLKEMAERM